MVQKEVIAPPGLGEPIGPFVRGIRAGNRGNGGKPRA